MRSAPLLRASASAIVSVSWCVLSLAPSGASIYWVPLSVDDPIPAEWPWSGAASALVHADLRARSLETFEAFGL